MRKTKSISVSFNNSNLPYFKSEEGNYLSFDIQNEKCIEIFGNKEGLKLLEKALLGIAECERTNGFHIHIDDLYQINKEEKEFIISRKES